MRARTDAQRLKSARPTSLHERDVNHARYARNSVTRSIRERVPELVEDRRAGAAPGVHCCESEGRCLHDRTRSLEDRLQQGFSHGQLSYAVLHRRVHQLRARLRGVREGLPRDGVAGDGGLREGVPGLPGDLPARDGPHAAYVADERGDLSRVCGRVRRLREGVRPAHVRALPSLRRGVPRVRDRVPPDGGRRVAAAAHTTCRPRPCGRSRPWADGAEPHAAPPRRVYVAAERVSARRPRAGEMSLRTPPRRQCQGGY